MKKENQFKKICIRFGDNDFYNAFTGVTQSLKNTFDWTGELPIDKDKLSFIINKLSPIFYILFQNQFKYNGLEIDNDNIAKNKEFLHVKKYLQIEPKHILINEEVDEYVKNEDGKYFFNSESFVYDSTLYSNQIYSV